MPASIATKMAPWPASSPRLNGLEVLRQVKADEQLKRVPIVVLTSSKEDRDVAESYKLGVNSFVSKPVEFDEFADAVARLGLYWVLVNKRPLV
jgi:CheY-like chemotaxis protein